MKAQLVGTVDPLKGWVIPDWSRVIGHVTEVQKRDTNHRESRMRIVFDKLKLKHGKEATFTGAVLSVDLIPDYAVYPQFDSMLGYERDVSAPDDNGDIEGFPKYTFPRDSDDQGVAIASTSRNVYLSWHVYFTVKGH